MNATKVPPHSIEAEQSVLASVLLDNKCLPLVTSILSAKDFYSPGHIEIYDAMAELQNNNIPVDIVMLREELVRKGMFDQIGGMEYLAVLAASNYTSAHVKYHAQEVKRHSESRQMIKSVLDLLQKPEGFTTDDLKKSAQEAENNQYIKSYAEKSMQSLDDFKLNLRNKKQRILTGFKTFDSITGGLRVPSVAMIGAYPSVGKTAFSLNVAANQNEPVVFFSLEMSTEMIYERLASAMLKIDYNLFTTQQLTDSQYGSIEAFTGTLKQKPFHVYDDEYYIEQQAAIIANLKPCLAVVDYIQKVKTHQRTDARRHEIDYISGMYKQIAKQNNCVILLLSQLSRGIGGPAKPTMSNLKESGALEADGDYVGILHRPYVLQKDKLSEIRPEDGYILIDKNKFGNTGQIDLYFSGKHQQFYEVEKRSVFARSVELVEDSEIPFK